ncbi:hypothetical protein FGG08_007721 [Glutinoglossum americanum]|uniref:Uncharacterized protein n=1 Tax=Glutinoglossum americanum TaxID=1670608 RepID=A0A9P8KYZ7_9PEZI|nr:hypothetical protein FGG08_007721 [Glutinoglossum americanum]
MVRKVLISGGLKHGRQLVLYLLHRPADRVAVHRGVHAAELVHVLGTIHIAALQVKTVEPQQRCLFLPDLSDDQNGHALVGVVVNVPIPQLVLDNETYGTCFKCGLTTLLCHGQSSTMSVMNVGRLGTFPRATALSTTSTPRDIA